MLNKISLILNNLFFKIKNYFLNINSYEINAKLLISKIKEEIIIKGLPSYILNGYRIYSQNDEDGIIESIFEDVGVKNKIFIEIGIGNGIENNTHCLLLKNWRGIWIDSNTKKIQKKLNYIDNNKLIIVNKKITKNNINEILKIHLSKLLKNNQVKEIDFFSIDIDSLDIFCVETLECIKPKIICIEYNSKFPPPIELSINENYNSKWNFDDYFGASLSFISKILLEKGYKLISTNITGSNAFFVLNKYYDKCKTKNLTINQLYMPPNYNLYKYNQGHRASLKYLLDKINSR